MVLFVPLGLHAFFQEGQEWCSWIQWKWVLDWIRSSTETFISTLVQHSPTTCPPKLPCSCSDKDLAWKVCWEGREPVHPSSATSAGHRASRSLWHYAAWLAHFLGLIYERALETVIVLTNDLFLNTSRIHFTIEIFLAALLLINKLFSVEFHTWNAMKVLWRYW